jgi:hypothetical protein
VIEALHEGVDYTIVEDVLTNAFFRVGCARDIATKLSRAS